MTRQEAYKIVLEDMMRGNAPSFFKGNFDARNGNKAFMYGVETVMEYIAASVSNKEYHDFSELWDKNFQESLDKVREL